MAASVSNVLAQHRASILGSVFPTSTSIHSVPTPIATPNLGHAPPGQSFGQLSGTETSIGHTDTIVRQEVERSLAWSTATRYLSFARPSFSSSADVDLLNNNFGRRGPISLDVTKALRYLLVGHGVAGCHGDQTLLDWYVEEVRHHFLAYFHYSLAAQWQSDADNQTTWERLESTAARMQLLLSNYTQPVSEHILPLLEEQQHRQPRLDGASTKSAAQVVSTCRRDIQALLAQSIPQKPFFRALSHVLFDAAYRLFNLHAEADPAAHRSVDEVYRIRNRVTSLLQTLQDLGLGGDKSQRAFANAMDRLLTEFVMSHYTKVDWLGRAAVTGRLRDWVANGFGPFVAEVLYLLCDEADRSAITVGETRQWQAIAMMRLGSIRVDNLFDYIVKWDASLGAILDLKEYITIPAARNHLTTAFWSQLSRRLLHAGATTTHILETYIHVIRAFRELDSKGVLLDRVVRPIRRYLRERDDTARVIIQSLLADTEDSEGNVRENGDEVSLVVATEMLYYATPVDQYRDMDLNWNDMSWTPDPIDAGPEFRKSRSKDIISDLLSLYDREEFISEMKNILGEHLLRNQASGLDKEIRLLELFKLKLGDDKLQACEVMLRDVLESTRLNTALRPFMSSLESTKKLPDLHARILSGFFWPALREDSFRVPVEVERLQSHFSAGFERIKDMRKLEWLPALGSVAIELHLEDRTVELEVQPWQASIIYAFQSAGPPATYSIEGLEELLDMDELLVRNALSFWVGKRVLVETSADVFAVLERLEADDAAQAAEAAAAAKETEAVPAVKSQEDLLAGNMVLYSQFVVGMLLNQGALPAPRILVMLKMVVPGGFPFGIEEVRSVLRRMVDEGKLVAVGDVFSVRKDE